MKTAKRIIAVFEGPSCEKLAGWQNVGLLDETGRIEIVLSADGGREVASKLGAYHFGWGTWEDTCEFVPGAFPALRSDIRERLVSDEQKEFAL